MVSFDYLGISSRLADSSAGCGKYRRSCGTDKGGAARRGHHRLSCVACKLALLATMATRPTRNTTGTTADTRARFTECLTWLGGSRIDCVTSHDACQ